MLSCHFWKTIPTHDPMGIALGYPKLRESHNPEFLKDMSLYCAVMVSNYEYKNYYKILVRSGITSSINTTRMSVFDINSISNNIYFILSLFNAVEMTLLILRHFLKTLQT